MGFYDLMRYPHNFVSPGPREVNPIQCRAILFIIIRSTRLDFGTG